MTNLRILFALMLAGCAAGGVGIIEQGEQAVTAGQYVYAYSAWRTAWLTGPPDLQQQAVARAMLHPIAVTAGEESLLEEVAAAIQKEKSGTNNRALRDLLDSQDFQRQIAFHKLVKPSFDESRVVEFALAMLAARDKVAAEEDQRRLDNERRRLESQRAVADAKRLASWHCRGASCEKAFALAQIFIDQHADMKIQVATSTIVETYNPTEDGRVGLKIVKMPLRGDESEVRLTVVCRGASCGSRELSIYRAFPEFMKERLVP